MESFREPWEKKLVEEFEAPEGRQMIARASWSACWFVEVRFAQALACSFSVSPPALFRSSAPAFPRLVAVGDFSVGHNLSALPGL
jgi:hypothetical protein